MKLRIDWMGIGMFLLVFLFIGAVMLGMYQYNHSVFSGISDMDANAVIPTVHAK